MTDWIGYRWLAEAYGVEPVQPFSIDSRIGRSRSTVQEDGFTHEQYVAATKPADTLAAHLTFALRHEGVHLEFLSRLFAVLDPALLVQWISAEPTGQYARRAGFFYEWLTAATLDFPDIKAGNYVDAIDPESYLTAKHPSNCVRWRVRDNLPGVRDFSPMIRRTDKVKAAEAYPCAKMLERLEQDFGIDLLMRSAVWLTVKESRSSFAIEHEEQCTDRIQRFALVMERRCGTWKDPLLPSHLAELQSEILGPRATRYGIRQSPVFIGQGGYMPTVHYIAPHWKDTAAMLAGLSAFDIRTRGGSSIVRAAAISFGFVYIHPMSDGNGRISRFLVNDILRRDEAVPAPFILPLSATIMATANARRHYDQVLEVFSKALMARYGEAYRFGSRNTGADGVEYNLEFDAYDEASHAWRYPDLTAHTEYLSEVIRLTIEQEMRTEASLLRSQRAAREAVKNVLEGPDQDIDRIIRSVRENGGQISGKLRREFPVLEDAELAKALVQTINDMIAGQ